MQRFGQRAVTDNAGPSAVTHRLEFSIPSRSGQPDFDLDVGIVARLQGCGYAAKSREILEIDRRRGCPAECPAGWRELTGCNGLGERYGGVRKGQRGEALARSSTGKCWEEEEYEGYGEYREWLHEILL